MLRATLFVLCIWALAAPLYAIGTFDFPPELAGYVKHEGRQEIAVFTRETGARYASLGLMMYGDIQKAEDITASREKWKNTCEDQSRAHHAIVATVQQNLNKGSDWQKLRPWFDEVKGCWKKLEREGLMGLEAKDHMLFLVNNIDRSNNYNKALVASWTKKIKAMDERYRVAKNLLASRHLKGRVDEVIKEFMPALRMAQVLTRCAIRDKSAVESYLRDNKRHLENYKKSPNVMDNWGLAPRFSQIEGSAGEWKAYMQSLLSKAEKAYADWYQILVPLHESKILEGTVCMKGWKLIEMDKKFMHMLNELKKDRAK